MSKKKQTTLRIAKGELQLDQVFAALSDSTRRQIVKRLANGPAIVSDLAEPFSMSLPAVSKHLRVLQNSGLVVQDKKGRERKCILNPVPLTKANDWLSTAESFWNKKLDALEDFLSETNETIKGE